MSYECKCDFCDDSYWGLQLAEAIHNECKSAIKYGISKLKKGEKLPEESFAFLYSQSTELSALMIDRGYDIKQGTDLHDASYLGPVEPRYDGFSNMVPTLTLRTKKVTLLFTYLFATI